MSKRGPFFGREGELDLLADLVQEVSGPVTVHGPGGAGKTRLVQEHLARSRDRSWLWLTPHGGPDPAAAVQQLLQDEPKPATTIAGRPVSAFDGLVLDDAEELITREPGMATAVERLGWRMPTVVTSTVRLDVPSERLIPLDGLAMARALELFTHRLRRLRPHYELDEPLTRSVRELVDRVDRLPRAIELAASRLELMPLHDLLEYVRHQPQDLGQLAGHPVDPARWIRRAWEQLDASRRHLLAQCAVFASDFELRDVAAVLRTVDDGPPEVTDLARFVRLALLHPAGPPATGSRLRMLHTTRAFLQSTAEWARVEAAARQRHAQWFVQDKHAGTAATWLAVPDTEIADIQRAAASIDSRLGRAARRARMRAGVRRGADRPDSVDLVEAVEQDARADGDLEAFAEARFHRMMLDLPTRGPTAAYASLARALAVGDELHPRQRGPLFASAALLRGCQGQWADARAWQRRTERVLGSIDTPSRRAEVHTYLGVSHLAAGCLEASGPHFERALDDAREPGIEAVLLATWAYANAERGVEAGWLLDSARRRESVMPPFFLPLALAGSTLADHADHPRESSSAALDEAARAASQRGSPFFGHWIAAMSGWTRWELGDRTGAITTTRAAVEALRTMDALGVALANGLALAWWLAVEDRRGEALRWWRWAVGIEAADAPLARALRGVFGRAHPVLDPGDAAVEPVQERWSRVRLARRMVARAESTQGEPPMEMLEPTRGGGGLVRWGEQTAQLTLAQYALVEVLLGRWRDEADRAPAVRGFVPSAELVVTIPFETPHPERAHLKALIRRSRAHLEDLGLAIEGRRGFGYRLVLPAPDR